MEFSNPLATISYAVGIIGLAGGAFTFVRYSNYKATVQLQNDNIKALQDQAAILKGELEATQKAHTEAMGALKQLQGSLDAYKEIPLKEISLSLSKLADSNQEILTTLKNSVIVTSSGDKLSARDAAGKTTTINLSN